MLLAFGYWLSNNDYDLNLDYNLDYNLNLDP